MTSPPSAPEPARALAPTYQVGVFALVCQQDTFLLVRPHQLLLPGGPQSLPGTLIDVHQSGMSVVETALRRLLLGSVGISVAHLTLVGSHTTRVSPTEPLPRLNLIFGTEYCSGIIQVKPEDYQSAFWVHRDNLSGQVPEWLRSALVQYAKATTPAAEDDKVPQSGLFRRRPV